MSVVICTAHVGDVNPRWVVAYEELEKPTKPNGARDWYHIATERQIVHMARNSLVSAAIEPNKPLAPDTLRPQAGTALAAASHLFFLDDDVLPPPDALLRLLSHDLPIVSGFYAQRLHPHAPTALRRVPSGAYVPMMRFKPGLQEVDAVGAGCLLVRRGVFERMARPWFDWIEERDGVRGMSEDLYFCSKAQALGFSIVLDFDVQCMHLARHAVGLQGCVEAGHERQVPYASDEDIQLAREIRPWPREGTQPASPTRTPHPVRPIPPRPVPARQQSRRERKQQRQRPA